MKTSKFDLSDYLDSTEIIAEYLNVVLEEGEYSELITSFGQVAKAMTNVSNKAITN